MPKADRLQQFISLAARAGSHEELTDEAIVALAFDMDENAHVLVHQQQFTVVFSDRSRAVFDQVASHVGR
jgi:hypothetical protein